MRVDWLAAAVALACASPADAAQYVVRGSVTLARFEVSRGTAKFVPSLGTLRRVTLSTMFDGLGAGLSIARDGDGNPATARFYPIVTRDASIGFGSLAASIDVDPIEPYLDLTDIGNLLFHFTGESEAVTDTALGMFVGSTGSTPDDPDRIYPDYLDFRYEVRPAAEPGGTAFYGFNAIQSYFDYSLTYTYDPVDAAVPEPASWAMTIGGVALVGGAMRRRRRGGTTATA